MPLDWNSIRPLNGGRDKGFEELCAQLAGLEAPARSRFVRKGTPDAGVECYAVLSDGSEWGWQSKYVDSLGDSQWAQIDSSVRTALTKHPKLVRYFVCLPLDRADARLDGRRSAQDRWNEHVLKWQTWASQSQMTVEFTYWGSHELLNQLSRQENVGRLRFWFDVRGFDPAWFSAKLKEAIGSAGPRYTPEVHVDLPIAQELKSFGRTERFFDREKARARTIRRAMRDVRSSTRGSADESLARAEEDLVAKAESVLGAIGKIEATPIGPLPYTGISQLISTALEASEALSHILGQREQEFESIREQDASTSPGTSRRENPFREHRFGIGRLSSELYDVREAFEHADKIAGSEVILLRGDAGTGKTHLLCDLAADRIREGLPTILLMGQRFLSNDAPWNQALQQLDMATSSAEEFVGALEAAAQTAGARALLLVDAMNEGTGRTIWPNHLAAFLSQATQSPWIGVVLAVRTSFQELVIPSHISDASPIVTHNGFAEHEYDATKTFFIHYGLELPSTPLLAPEFSNPLFLKTLCRGLQEMGERRLPRGMHGITAAFDLFLDAINSRLSQSLGFDKRSGLVKRALTAFCEQMLDSEQRWLSWHSAQEVVNSLLPGREYERCLYRAMVAEDILVEDVRSSSDSATQIVVFVAYERFADHIIATTLLDRHLDLQEPGSAFAAGGPLSFVRDRGTYVSPGVIEALCVQVPERAGVELLSLVPECFDRWDFSDAFRKSIIWRKLEAFTASTNETLNRTSRSRRDREATLDTLITVASVPGHTLNALWLHERLQRDSMAERDAWWSIYLHRCWDTKGALDRLVDWASAITPSTVIEDDAVDLCAIAVSWMLTSSNRFLRDRATKALVCLLSGRLAAVIRLIGRFAGVNDVYVAERVYAVAYAAAMRSHDPAEVGALARTVHQHAFASGNPVPHILLRDYARGVVERAVSLDPGLEAELERFRPPYKSEWPHIPSQEEIADLLPDWSESSEEKGRWARNRIAHSVMDDDFALYEIGTNSSSMSHNWLSYRLRDAPWSPPPSPKDRLNDLVEEMSADERAAWAQFEDLDNQYSSATLPLRTWLEQREMDRATIGEDQTEEEFSEVDQEAADEELVALQQRREEAFVALEGRLSPEHRQCLTEILATRNSFHEESQPPGFDLHQIQRYVLWRVFDLGWTAERFGYFDEVEVSMQGRDAKKAERIGKKYQWIAYHEILALISDHFQYRDDDGAVTYEGPWKDFLRDLDPSCTLRGIRGGTPWEGHEKSWWASSEFTIHGRGESSEEWIRAYDDLPQIEDLIVATDPADNSRWINCDGFFRWAEVTPADCEISDVSRREFWYSLTGYLIRSQDADSFLNWAEDVDFWGRWMPESTSLHNSFLGEHAWSPSSQPSEREDHDEAGWVKPSHDCPVKVRVMASTYNPEMSSFDCSVDEGFNIRVPVVDLLNGLRIRWSGHNAEYTDGARRIIAKDPTVTAAGPDALLLRSDELQAYLAREGLTVCWTVLGEKRITASGYGSQAPIPSLRLTGACVLVNGRPTGSVRIIQDGQQSANAGPNRHIRVGQGT